MPDAQIKQLCLRRRVGESIVIVVPGFAPIWVTINSADGRGAGLGINAAEGIEVDREEVHHDKQAQRSLDQKIAAATPKQLKKALEFGMEDDE